VPIVAQFLLVVLHLVPVTVPLVTRVRNVSLVVALVLFVVAHLLPVVPQFSIAHRGVLLFASHLLVTAYRPAAAL
jgi:hypothetical protein